MLKRALGLLGWHSTLSTVYFEIMNLLKLAKNPRRRVLHASDFRHVHII